jgi:hypothetical protein
MGAEATHDRANFCRISEWAKQKPAHNNVVEL